MDISSLALDEPCFGLQHAIEATGVDRMVIDSYVKQRVITPSRHGRLRRFSLRNLIELSAAFLLIDMFRMRPTAAAPVARTVAAQYGETYAADRRDAVGGFVLAHLADAHFLSVNLFRQKNGAIRLIKPGDDAARSLQIAVPVQSLARHILKKLAASTLDAAEAA